MFGPPNKYMFLSPAAELAISYAFSIPFSTKVKFPLV
jgi:hypothetical protein